MQETESADKTTVTYGDQKLREFKNPQFEEYYRAQLSELIASDAAWEQFEASLRSPLPVTFRFSGTSNDPCATSLRDYLESKLLPPLAEMASPASPLAWYPARLAWQVDISRAALRGKGQKSATEPGEGAQNAAMQRLHQWMLMQAELGNLQRQEAASMVPPLLMDVSPGQTVLDMCASPGSKSMQLLEMLAAADYSSGASDGSGGGGGGGGGGGREGGAGDAGDGAGGGNVVGGGEGGAGDEGGGGAAGVATSAGLLVANDADVKRSQLLASRAGRLHSTRLLVVAHDARHMPEGVDGTSGFDRVLCDVPCSGDGTLRKAPILWRRWVAAQGNALHRLQLQLACKGVRLLKVGGRLVYSTCSLNPIENESVVAGVMRTFGSGCLRIVDVRHELKGLPSRRGLLSWRVWHRSKWHETWESVVERFPRRCPQFESLFPPRPEEAEAMRLRNCMRLLPHEHNGGGFFIAVFEKVGPHAAEAGALAADEPEVCVSDGAGVLPEALSSLRPPQQPRNGQARVQQPDPQAKFVTGAGQGSAFDSGPQATSLASAEMEETTSGHAAERRTEVGADDEESASSSQLMGPMALQHASEAVGGALGMGERVGVEANTGTDEVEMKTEGGSSADASSGLPQTERNRVIHCLGGAAVPGAADIAMSKGFAPLYAPSANVLSSIRTFFGLDASFPLSLLVTRSPTASAMHLTSPDVLALLRDDEHGALRVVHTGVRLFDRDSAKGTGCDFRACQSGLPILLPYLRTQRAALPAGLISQLLTESTMPKSAWEHQSKSLIACQPGSVVLETTAADGLSLALTALKTPGGAILPMISKAERQAILTQLAGVSNATRTE